MGDLGNIWGGDGLPGRANHAAYYHTPDFGGASLGLSYVPNQGVSNTRDYIVKADYGNGGLKLGGAYLNAGTAAGLPDWKAYAITGSYDIGAFSVGGGWQQEKDINGVSGADRNDYTLGAAVKVGNKGTGKIQYAGAGNLSGVSNTGAKQWAAGYDYAWDKDTTLYAAYARTNNDASAAFSAFDYGHGNEGVPTIVAGNSPWAVSVGIAYKFDVGVLPH